MSTYQTYDFLNDINTHIDNKTEINLQYKSDIFKKYLFNLKLFQLSSKIKKNHPVFKEDFFLFILQNTLYVAKRINNESLQFDYIDIVDGIKLIRKMKLNKIYKNM